MSSTPADEFFLGLRDEIRRPYPRGRILLAVDGEDGAGKSRFAERLAAAFGADGSAVFHASIDDFHRPKAERYARGAESPDGFYRDSFDLGAFRGDLIDPFRAGGDTPFRLAAFDLARDEPAPGEPLVAPADAVLIVDGIFLLRPELRGIWHWSVWLDAPLDVRYARMAERDGIDPDPAAPSNRRYRQGMELYLRDANPRTAATAIVDNTDPDAPRRVFQDFC